MMGVVPWVRQAIGTGAWHLLGDWSAVVVEDVREEEDSTGSSANAICLIFCSCPLGRWVGVDHAVPDTMGAGDWELVDGIYSFTCKLSFRMVPIVCILVDRIREEG